MKRRQRQWTLLLYVALATLSLARLRDLETDNRFELWISGSDPGAAAYEELRETFGSDEFVLAAVTVSPPFSPPIFDRLVDLVTGLEKIRGVSYVSSLPTLYRDVYGGEDLEALRDEVESTPLYDDFLVSDDGGTLGFFISTELGDSPVARRDIVESIRAELDRLSLDASMVGAPVLNAALDSISSRELLRSLPLAAVLSSAALLLFFHSVGPVVIASLCGGMTLLLTLATAGLAGVPITMVTTATPSLVWVLALSSAIHLLSAYGRQQGSDRAKAARRAVAEVARPCTLSALTTAAGFLSLVTSDFAPIRNFGALTAVGLILSLIVTFTLGRALIGLGPVSSHRPRHRLTTSFSRHLVSASLRHPLLSGGSFAALILLSLPVLPQLRVDSNPLRFLNSDERVVQDYDQLRKSLTGVSTLEILLPLAEPLHDPVNWVALDRLREELERHPEIARVLSPLDVLRKLNQWDHDLDPSHYGLPEGAEAAQALLDNVDPSLEAQLRALVSDDRRLVRLTALVTTMDSGPFLDLANLAESAAAAAGLRDAAATGLTLQLVRAQSRIISSQLKSLALATVLILFCILLGLRSLRLTTLSILPNLLPVTLVFAYMAAKQIPLDPGTVMVAGVALGIAVDDIVHLLTAAQTELRQGASAESALLSSAETVGPALCITTMATVAGFAALLGSSFVPIHFFALLSILALVTALLTDLTFLPALVRWTAPRSRS